jgi:hypothetical protein
LVKVQQQRQKGQGRAGARTIPNKFFRKNQPTGLPTLVNKCFVPVAVGHSKHDLSFAGYMEIEKRSHDPLIS